MIVADPERLPAALAKPVVAIGNFDGVHRGHQAVIARAQELARRLGRPCALLTFEPHPANYFAGAPVIFRLTPEDAKALVLSRLGLDGMIVLSFGQALAELDREAFVGEILVQRLGISAAVIGYDFHFGRQRLGTPAYLRDEGARCGFEVEMIEKIRGDAEGDLSAVSSTAVRRALEDGDVALGAKLLGHPYFVLGTVIHGQKLGRTLGFPTANLKLDPTSRLRHGIYAVRVRGEGLDHGGVASFGRRPTFDNGAPLLEVVLFDFEGDLYGRTLEVDFVAWIRGEEKFDSVDALVVRMNQDAREARTALNKDRKRD
ncbi:bifunctional riboflavin kinase/FAD synthetase [Lichenifustis flavocetrariae]|uniref:Riboflavin biosynthesis protein n=1 Tax=Lichenifustis flavocetrariae TaxID=2949735 RepID=A0AA41Z4U6_9HYPH|nr:bifunctional riboflavin kinase/FAD synthetase [Lichenifustis flavocetrariae]MCW6510493.1 bifunctional riboflavin kinase/FAD synthetase [Lichenifustis flavocetrariae]